MKLRKEEIEREGDAVGEKDKEKERQEERMGRGGG